MKTIKGDTLEFLSVLTNNEFVSEISRYAPFQVKPANTIIYIYNFKNVEYNFCMKEKRKKRKRNKITSYEAMLLESFPGGYLKNGFGCETGNFDYSLSAEPQTNKICTPC